jgi:hypothetical protein
MLVLMLTLLTMLTVLLLAVLASCKGRICFEQQVWEQLCRGSPAAAPAGPTTKACTKGQRYRDFCTQGQKPMSVLMLTKLAIRFWKGGGLTPSLFIN